ncbi:hypothetical protein PRK78_003364 [Emydomyces testavorans]|uniref:BRCT domain-containing protein n=1 Tax=Emydomyces testavorans TaxID=2070801 RepID=A0AAF0IIF9_9EURO|nr:hypothetical protein PRK78_003364 [Emydomyces testavorans]
MPRHWPTISPALRDILSNPSPANLDQFDPWNSSSTGHQQSENPYAGTSWRETRNQKLATQLKRKTGGLERAGDWRWVTPMEMEEEKRRRDRNDDIRSFFGVKKRKIETSSGDEVKIRPGSPVMVAGDSGGKRVKSARFDTSDDVPCVLEGGNGDETERAVSYWQKGTPVRNTGKKEDAARNPINGISLPGHSSLDAAPSQSFTTSIASPSEPSGQPSNGKGIFNNLTIYINGSTLPLISDHKLKQILVKNGADISICLARRKVTHVILGRPNKNTRAEIVGGEGVGGGLAAGKLQREIQRVGGKGVKFVGVEWFVTFHPLVFSGHRLMPFTLWVGSSNALKQADACLKHDLLTYIWHLESKGVSCMTSWLEKAEETALR